MLRCFILSLLLAVLLSTQSWCLQTLGCRHLQQQARGALFAKKGGGGESKGFAPTKPNLANLVVDKKGGEGSAEVGTGGQDGAGGSSSANEAEAIDAIFKKYGINDDPNRAAKAKAKAAADAKGKSASGADAPFGESIIAKLTPEMQMKYDNVLVTGVSVSLSFVVLCGVGISAGSLKVVFPDINLPAGLDDVITNFLTPSFTPALGVFFLFSTSFGLFKFAQISSSQTVYKE